MRKIKLLSAVILLLASCNIVLAQKPALSPQVRCGTEEAIAQSFREHPELKAEYDRKNAEAAQQRGTATGRVSTLTGPVTIPVIVHVVLPNPTIITEQQIDYFLNRLNLDYSGLNPDSTNGNLFYGVRGHSLLRFTRARRTPGGQITNGVERRVGTVTIATTTYQAIKHTSAGGLDPWDVTQYYNLWVGDGGASGLLGIAPAIGVGTQTEVAGAAVGIDGVCVAYNGFSNGCFSIAAYNLARTAVHEIGHNFGLYHTFTGCADGADFAQPTPTTQTLPATLVGAAADDTPGLSTATTNCPTGAVASNCAGVPNPPGKMYQNYMDYTFDACYSMFTNSQVARMHYMLETYRPGYLTTQGAVPPANFPAIDAAIVSVVSPGGSILNDVVGNCVLTTYPTPNCPGPVTPRLQIQNMGATTLTSVSVTVTLTGATTFSQTYNNIALNNLITNGTQVIVLPAITLNIGTTNITFTITQANGVTDSYTANNTVTTAATIALSALPFTQNFSTASATAFPPANMTVFNPNGNNTWVYNANGNGNAGSAFINNYAFNTPGQIDDIRTIPFTPPAGTTASDSVIISFDVAYKNYPAANSDDILSVLVSNDCGATFTTLYSKAGAVLATAGSSTASYTTPAATDWRRERVGIGGALLTGGPITVAFRNTNFYGNNIFIDNINIVRKYDRDIGISAITAPPANICSNSTNVQAVVSNTGAQTITSFGAGYVVNGSATPVTQTFTQTIAPGASATINFTTPVTGLPANANTIKVFTFSPVSAQGTGDLQPANDTLTKSFNVAPLISLPLVQGFETTPFPPANWTLVNPNNNITWVRNNHGNNSSWSAFIDNYNYNFPGQTDALQTPALRLAGADSMIVSFDVAHKNYPGFNDVLQVLVSTDCGQTFTSYYNKSGATLATAGTSTNDYTNPGANDWRRERVSVPTAAVTSGSVIVRFQNTNAYGNNIFLDNINITPVYRRDIQLVSINQPGNVICTTSTTPTVTVRNAGIETITGYKVGYLVDNSTTPVVSTFTGRSLAANATKIDTLTPITLAAGQHVIKIFTFDPVTATGTGDPNPANDTLQKIVAVIGTQAAPLVEGFEASTFPPTGWAVVNPDGGLTWQRNTTVARTGNASAYVNNFNYAANGTRDELYTPRVTYSGVDSLFLNFDVAATTYSYPGSTNIPLDTLEVLVTTDCGTTFTSIYKKWGNELQTIRDPNGPQTAEFLPTSRNQWRTESLSLPSFVSRSPIQVVFRNTTNFENNIFIDNVNVSTKTLPAQLKEQGYLIYPSPFASTFYIQHYLPPTELRGIAVYNSVGQRVWAREYGTTGTSSLTQVDLSRFANDVYTVVLRYTNRTISQKIIKAN